MAIAAETTYPPAEGVGQEALRGLIVAQTLPYIGRYPDRRFTGSTYIPFGLTAETPEHMLAGDILVRTLPGVTGNDRMGIDSIIREHIPGYDALTEDEKVVYGAKLELSVMQIHLSDVMERLLDPDSPNKNLLYKVDSVGQLLGFVGINLSSR